MAQEIRQKFEVICRKPRLWFLVKLFYPKVRFEFVAFTFGRRIYTSKPLPEHILVHELTHVYQQRASKLWGTICFLRYVFSKKYRWQCEGEAFGAQYSNLCKYITEPNLRQCVLNNLAAQLSSGIYGAFSHAEAVKKINRENNRILHRWTA